MNTTTATRTRTELPDRFKARVEGKMHHRVGDGPLEALPVGIEVQVDMAIASMVVSWLSEGHPVTVTVAREEFFYYMDEGSIVLLD